MLLLAIAAVFLGWGHRVLDRMRLTDTAALVLLGLMFLAPFVPDVPVGGGMRLDLAGVLVPAGVAVYLVATADQAHERARAILAALLTAGAVVTLDALMPPEPGLMGPLDLDPLYLNGLMAGALGYLMGRSRRASFVAGVLGVALADLAAAFINWSRGVSGPMAAVGGAGAFDAIVVAGFVAVLLAETVGEARELAARRRRAAAPAPGPASRDGAEGAPGPAAEEPAASAAAERSDAAAGRTAGELRAPGALTSFLALALTFGLAAAATVGGERLWAARWGDQLSPEEAREAGVFQLRDSAGNPITFLGWRVFPGDGYIDEDNRFWEVERVVGRQAWARLRETVDLLAPDPEAERAAQAAAARAAQAGLLDWLLGRAPAEGQRILILHTHNDESYITGDGTAIIQGKGGIHRVGRALATHLERQGYQVIHDETLHLPHDRSAYRRSRRTILEYLDERPVMVLDIHRDVVPQRFYADQIDGQGITKVRIVIGRQNPTRAANLREAKRIKAVADQVHKGYVKGIFLGRGNYNQDLGPRVLLFEVGAHSNARASAERSTALLAEVLDRYLKQFGP